MRCRTPAVVVLAAATLVLLTPASAAAEAAEDPASGWWWRLQVVDGSAAVPPPDVPSGGILVAADPDGAHAIAAVRIAASDNRPTTLRLIVAASAGTSTGVDVCPTTEAWAPVHGGPLTGAPRADCEVASATVEVRGGLLEVPLDGFGDGALSLVLMPRASMTPWRLSLHAPTAESVIRGNAPPPPTPSTEPTPSGPSGPAAVPWPEARVDPPVASGFLDLSLGPDAAVSAVPSLGPSRDGAVVGIGPTVHTSPPRSAPSGHSPLVFMVSAALAVTYLVAAHQARPWIGGHVLLTKPTPFTGTQSAAGGVGVAAVQADSLSHLLDHAGPESDRAADA